MFGCMCADKIDPHYCSQRKISFMPINDAELDATVLFVVRQARERGELEALLSNARAVVSSDVASETRKQVARAILRVAAKMHSH